MYGGPFVQYSKKKGVGEPACTVGLLARVDMKESEIAPKRNPVITFCLTATALIPSAVVLNLHSQSYNLQFSLWCYHHLQDSWIRGPARFSLSTYFVLLIAKIFVVFTDLSQTAKILTTKFCDRHALCFVIGEPRKFFVKSLPAANPRKFCPTKILSHKISRHTVCCPLPHKIVTF